MPTLTIPYNFNLRDYQKPFWAAIQDKPADRAVLVWPRRHGKDKTMLNALMPQMLKRVGNYYYVFPEFNQGRKALWDNIDSSGFKTINHIPKELRVRTDQQQMLIELYNGSIFQIIGASDIDRIVGTNPVGIVFSEYSLMSPAVVGFLLPIVTENKGFMWFNFTPRGNNHAKKLYDQALREGWFVSFMTAITAGVFTQQEMDDVKREYIGLYGDTKLFNQEFMCSFDEPVQGSYYGDLMTQAEVTGRIAAVPWIAELPVNTYWDLGVGDSTAIWFVQFKGDEIHVIDYYENASFGLDHYVKHLQNKPYVYGTHTAPHDIRVREFGSGLSRLETARSLGIHFAIAPKLSLEDGINAARLLLSRVHFDKEKTELGTEALKQYHRKYNEETRAYDNKPSHDWSSHGSDAFRYFAVSAKKNDLARGRAPTDDIPSYAQAGAPGPSIDYQQRGNPFAPITEGDSLEEQMGLTTDVFDERGFMR